MGTPPMSFDEFAKRCSEVNQNVKISEEGYRGTLHRVNATCLICGHQWNPVGGNLLRGNQCPNCSHSSTSFMEQVIFIAFQRMMGADEVLNRTRDVIQGYELDVYIPSLKLAIEPGSWVWHGKPEKYNRDIEKIKLSRASNIELIMIFDRFDQDEYPYDNWHYTYRWNLGYSKEGKETLINIIRDISEKENISCNFTEQDWKEIIREATLNSKRTTEEQYIEKLSKYQPNNILISSYNGHNEDVEAECKICGHHWITPANNLLRHACPECAKQTRTETRLEHYGTYSTIDEHNTFLQKLKDRHIPWYPLEKYQGVHHEILFACDTCGYEKKVTPGSLIYQRRLCPECEKRLEQEFYTMYKPSEFDTPIEYYSKLFILKLKWLSPDVTLISQYQGTHSPITLLCNKCEHEWTLPQFFNMPIYRLFCPVCSTAKHDNRQKTDEEFKKQVAELHPEIELISDKYPGSLGRVTIRCRECGHIWEINVTSLLRKNGGKCPRRRRHEK